MTESNGKESPVVRVEGTVGDIMRPALSMIELDGHLAGACYMMRRAKATGIVIVDSDQSRRPLGALTEGDIVQVLADGKDPNEVRVRDLVSDRIPVVSTTMTIIDGARAMDVAEVQHLVVTDDERLVGIVDANTLRALLVHAT